jgi:hypothetical protein
MKHCHAQANQTTGRLLVACVAALAGLSRPRCCSRLTPTPTSNLVPPPVPPNLEVPARNKVFLMGHAAGTQQYICLFLRFELRLDILRSAGHVIEEQ